MVKVASEPRAQALDCFMALTIDLKPAKPHFRLMVQNIQALFIMLTMR